MLVAFGTKEDVHLNRVLRELERFGVRCAIISSVEEAGGVELAFHVGSDSAKKGGVFNIVVEDLNGERCDLSGETPRYWYRNKAFFEVFNTSAEQTNYFVMKERAAWLRGWAHVENSLSINELGNAIRYENKIQQLSTAALIGFRIPATCVTNRKSDALELSNKFDELIVKPLSVATVPSHSDDLDPIMMLTNTLEQADLQSGGDDGWDLAPMIVQERIPKAYELRVIQVGDQAYAIRVDCNDDPDARVDWRRRQDSLPFSVVELDDRTRELGAAYLEAAGLEMGVFDYAVTPDGAVVFFECNPSGQWAWLESENDGYPISRFVAEGLYNDFFTERAERRRRLNSDIELVGTVAT